MIPSSRDPVRHLRHAALALAAWLASAARVLAQDDEPPPPPPPAPDWVTEARNLVDHWRHHFSFKIVIVLLLAWLALRIRAAITGGRGPVSSLWFRLTARARVARLDRAGQHEAAADLLLEIDPTAVLDAAELLVKGKRWARAAALYMSRNHPKQAAVAYEKGEQWDLAAELHEKTGDVQRAETCYLKVKNKPAIARMFAQRGSHEKAADYYKQLGRHKDAGQHLENLGRKLEAAEAYVEAWTGLGVKGGRGNERDLVAEREMKDLVGRACRLFEEGGAGAKAAELLLKAGNPDGAAELFRKAGDIQRAAQVLIDNGRLEIASRMLSELGKKDEALRLIAKQRQDRGEHAAAAELYENAGEHTMAGELYEKAGQLEKAAVAYEKVDERRAADTWAALGSFERAAQLYERAKQWSSAVFCYEKIGALAKTAEMWERLGNHFLAGMTYFTAKEPARAVAALGQVPPDASDRKEAERLLAILLAELGREKEALPHFEAGFGRRIEKDDVEAFYYYAQTLERLPDSQKKALSALETIEKLRPGYRDVPKRLAALRAGTPLPRTSIYDDGVADPESLFQTSRFSLHSTARKLRPASFKPE